MMSHCGVQNEADKAAAVRPGGLSAKGMMEKLLIGLLESKKGAEAQHITSGLEFPAAEQRLSGRRPAISIGHTGKEKLGADTAPGMGCCSQLPVQLRCLRPHHFL